MTSKQKIFLNKKQLKTVLSKSLKEEIIHVETDFQDKGYSGNVNQVKVVTSNNQKFSFILKKDDGFDLMGLYKEVLVPYNLNHPKVFGKVSINSETFILIEYIPYVEESWDESNYSKALSWLIKKDKVLHDNIKQIKIFPFIRKKVKNQVGKYIELINKGARDRIHPIITKKFASTIQKKERRYQEQFKLLNDGLLTVSHNDLCENNILFGIGTYKNKTYVIDWTYPSIGSVCIDLVELVKNTSKILQEKLIKRYRSRLDFDDFEKTYKAAKALNDLSYLTWVIEGVLEGDLDLKEDEDFKTLVKRVGK